MMKILFAHNTLSSYKPKGIISKLFNFTAKCQTKTLEELYNVGVRGFDLRFRMTKRGTQVCHGLVDYDISAEDVLEKLEELSNGESLYIRIIHEDTFHSSSKEAFIEEVERIKSLYPKFKYQINASKKRWTFIENNFGEDPEYEFCNSTLIPWILPKHFSNLRMNRFFKRLINPIENGIFYMDFI